ncbi:hypothetical protein ACVIKP_003004 [Rhizobium leguminosarum]
MPKYIVAEQMHAASCFCFQSIQGCQEIALFCQYCGPSIIAHRRKSEYAGGCRIDF